MAKKGSILVVDDEETMRDVLEVYSTINRSIAACS
jgi:hypothetical protein